MNNINNLPVGAMMIDGRPSAIAIDYRPSARLRLTIIRRREDDDEPVGAMNNINNLPVGAMMIEQRPSAR